MCIDLSVAAVAEVGCCLAAAVGEECSQQGEVACTPPVAAADNIAAVADKAVAGAAATVSVP